MSLLQTDLMAIVVRKRGARRSQAVTIVAWLAIAIMAFAAFSDLVRHPNKTLAYSDFSAFYCGALVAGGHADPYALAPIAACEANFVDEPAGVKPSVIGVDPDPAPGYHMAFFLPFTLLPYPEAAMLWDMLLIAAIVGSSLLLARLTGLRAIVVLAILSFMEGFVSIPYGQTAPVVTFGMCLAAYGLVRERQVLAIAGAALSLLTPQIGLPLCCAIFVWAPQMRLGIATVGVALGAISIAILGIPLNFEYLTAALPATALAEGPTSIQYSMSFLLHVLGVADATAIRIASIQYLIFAIAGVVFARAVERKLGTVAAVALFPPALALIGGSYIHLQQIAAALPFALVLATNTRSRVAWLALALLALPWPAESHLLLVGAMALAATIALVAQQTANDGRAIGLAIAAAIAYAIIAGPVLTHIVPATPQRIVGPAGPMPHALDGDRLAADEDAREFRLDPSFAVATPRTVAAKLPVWFALCAIVCVSFAAVPLRRRLAA